MEQKPVAKNEHTLRIATDELTVLLRKDDYDAQLKTERDKAIRDAAAKVKRHMLTNAGFSMTDIQNCILALLSTNEKESE